MIVGIHQSVDVSNEQRKAISKTLGVKQATRDQLKDFIWEHGARWPLAVEGGASPLSLVPDEATAPDGTEADPLTALDAALTDADADLANLL